VQRAVAGATPGQVFPLCSNEAIRLYQNHAHAAAAALCRRALQAQFDPTLANNLVWILATSSDDRARNGPEALELAELLRQSQADFLTWSGYAAALAECGRFTEAAAAAEQAGNVAQAANQESLVRKAAACRAAYLAGRPWRE
jgi:hypothetical protein